MPTIYANNLCQQSMPTIYANNLCQQSMPTIYANNICQQSMPTIYANNLWKKNNVNNQIGKQIRKINKIKNNVNIQNRIHGYDASILKGCHEKNKGIYQKFLFGSF